MDIVILIVYGMLGYWAAGVVFYKNKIVIDTTSHYVGQKLAFGLFLGWILIPIAIIRTILGI